MPITWTLYVFLAVLSLSSSSSSAVSSTNDPGVSSGKGGQPKCSKKTHDRYRRRAIIGGQLAAPKKFPYFVSNGQCGASLVALDVVMTAAHCSETITDKVLVGAVKEFQADVGDAEWRNVIPSSKRIHPNHNAKTALYDIMLFKIEKVTKPHLKPVQLNSNDKVPKKKTKMIVMGTGAVNLGETEYTGDLKWVGGLKTFPHSFCTKTYDGIEKKANFCAGTRKSQQDACTGDSGGPLITVKEGVHVQVGIVSFGPECGYAEFPGVYARVSGSISWIKKTICELSDTNPEFCADLL